MNRPHSVYVVTCANCGAEVVSETAEKVCSCGSHARMEWGQFVTVKEK